MFFGCKRSVKDGTFVSWRNISTKLVVLLTTTDNPPEARAMSRIDSSWTQRWLFLFKFWKKKIFNTIGPIVIWTHKICIKRHRLMFDCTIFAVSLKGKYQAIFNKLVWIKCSQHNIGPWYSTNEAVCRDRKCNICANLLSVVQTLSYGQRYGFGAHKNKE